MSQPKLTLFVDIVSPFAYLAFHVIRNSKIFQPCEVTYVPIFLGGVMKATGNTPPINVKNKDKWIELERTRWAKYCNIPVAQKAPEGFPPNTINVQRALCLIAKSHPQQLSACIAALYDTFWVNRNPIQDPKTYTPAFESVLGPDVTKDIFSQVSGAEAKGLLQQNTDRALKEGAFGLPWYVATNAKGETERFFGFDHLGQVIEHLGLKRDGELKAML